MKQLGTQNQVVEWSYVSNRRYEDPFNDVALDVLITDPSGQRRTIPAFWAGESQWTIRYASPLTGVHTYLTICSDADNPDLHSREGTIEIVAYDGANPLYRHGPLRVSPDRRRFEHSDGRPFFWLGDTWWMGFSRRIRWPEEFRELVADRAAKGYSVIQIVAGLYPDMGPGDPRGANEAGLAWEGDFARVNPAYFDMADLRIAEMARSGLLPCIVGSWGYYLDFAGPDVLRKHWRYLIARWGAYPVVWCAAGEALMPYYVPGAAATEGPALSPDERRAFWTELIRYIRATDPYGHPITIHPTRLGHDQVSDPAALDLDMLQTGHSGYPSLASTAEALEESLAHAPAMPVLVAEADYEGILESSREEIQRYLFWSCLLSGAAGHTYGANGLWQAGSDAEPYGASPHGTSWGDITWREAYQLPGSAQLGIGKRLLERYDWQALAPRPDWITPHASREDRHQPYAAGIHDGVRICFIPAPAIWTVWSGNARLRNLSPDGHYRGFWFDPKTGREYPLGEIRATQDGEWILPRPPIFQDWVIVLEKGVTDGDRSALSRPE